MSLNVATVMDQIGNALKGVAGLRTFDFPPLSAQPPFAFVMMPESIDFDLTYGRGSDRLSLDVYVGVSSQVDRAARDEIALYAAGSGDKSIKAVLESAGIDAAVRVVSASFEQITLGAGDYAGAIFRVDVAG